MHVLDKQTCMDAHSAPLNRRKILLFEEDRFLASLMHMLLYREGFEISVIADQQSALEHIASNDPPELLFVDHKWLKDDYPEVIQRMQYHESWNDVPVIQLLHYFDENLIEHASSLGIGDYLVQPIEPGNMLDLVQKHLK